jgi:hypothetical protein
VVDELIIFFLLETQNSFVVHAELLYSLTMVILGLLESLLKLRFVLFELLESHQAIFVLTAQAAEFVRHVDGLCAR